MKKQTMTFKISDFECAYLSNVEPTNFLYTNLIPPECIERGLKAFSRAGDVYVKIISIECYFGF